MPEATLRTPLALRQAPALTAALALLTAGPAGAFEGVDDLACPMGECAFVLRVDPPALRVVSDDGGPPRVEADGFVSSGTGWLLPARSFWVGIPREGSVAIDVAPLRRQAVEIPGGLPPPAIAALPEASVSLGDPTWMRNQRVVPVVWTPLVRSAAGVAWEGDVRVRLRFLGAGGEDRAEPGDAWEGIYRDHLLNYEQARGWRRADAPRPRPRGDFFSTTSNPWFRIEVTAAGLYAIEGNALQGAGLSDLGAVDPSRVRLFTGRGVSLPEAKSVLEVPAWLDEIAVLVEGGEDGVFDPQDRILFCGLGPDGWYADYGLEDRPYERYRSDEFSNVNTYWLSWGEFSGAPRRWLTEDGSSHPSQLATQGTHRIHFEQNEIWDPQPSELLVRGIPYPETLPAWEKWHWLRLIATAGGGRSRVRFRLDDPAAGTSARLLARFWGASWDYSTNLRDHYARIVVGADSSEVAWDDRFHQDLTLDGLDLGAGERDLFLIAPYKEDQNPQVVRQDRSYLSWFEIDYTRRLHARGDSLDFRVAAGSGRVGFEISGVSDTSRATLLDVTDPLQATRILPRFVSDATAYRLRWGMDADAQRERHIALVDLARARAPSIELDSAPIGGYLRERVEPVDYILIAHASQMESAGSLAAWREVNAPTEEGFRVAVVDVQDIYDEFSAGRIDPTAIRNFLHHAYLSWNGGDPVDSPSYVLLLGDAAYDFRNRLEQGVILTVPSYEGYFDPNLRRSIYSAQFASDDWFVLFDPHPDPTPEMIIGRLPADTPLTASNLVAKVRSYETGQDPGAWRQRFTLVADDVCQGLQCDYPLVFTHMNQTEGLADATLPTALERDRIYLYEYGSECIYDRKPAAASALRRSIDNGTLVVNYTGHGSDVQLADEKILEIPGVSSMANADRLFFFLTASCSVGKFNMAGDGLGEALIKQPGGGAIGVLSATSVAYSGPNAELNRQFFDALFPGRVTTGRRPVGEALVSAKLRMGSAAAMDNRRYPLLGEPAIRLAVPSLAIRLSVESERLSPPAATDTILRAARVIVRGEVTDGEGRLQEDFAGRVDLRINDSEVARDETVQCRDLTYRLSYNLTGASILRLQVEASGGRFETSFITPAVLRSGQKGYAQIYASAAAADGRLAMGGVDGVVVLENEPILQADGEGPRIVLETEGNLESLSPGAVWRVTLSDSSGINITQLVPSRSIIARIDEGSRLVHVEDLSSLVSFPESYEEGRLDFRLPDWLPTGRGYRLTVSASDNLNQGGSASVEFFLEGAGAEDLVLARVWNVPNPTDGATTFFIDMTQSAEIGIRIFTISGRTVQDLRVGRLAPLQASSEGIYWDGRDADGDLLANGVYFYKVELRGAGGEKRERVERLAVLR